MFYVIVDDSYIGVFTSAELVLPWLSGGIVPHQCFYFIDVENYLRDQLPFDELFVFGWEDELRGLKLDVLIPRPKI